MDSQFNGEYVRIQGVRLSIPLYGFSTPPPRAAGWTSCLSIPLYGFGGARGWRGVVKRKFVFQFHCMDSIIPRERRREGCVRPFNSIVWIRRDFLLLGAPSIYSFNSIVWIRRIYSAGGKEERVNILSIPLYGFSRPRAPMPMLKVQFFQFHCMDSS